MDRGDRYSRQTLFGPIGAAGQQRLRSARVLLTGCGGLGTNSANLLARAGVGFLRIVDRDVVEISNLQRQSLFEEADAREQLPKAIAAARRLASINADVSVEAVVADLDATNIESLLSGIDLVVDGFDNFEGRYVLNDACVKHGVPWVYGACVGASTLAGLIVPGITPCLRCLQPELPGPGVAETCDTVGILGPAAYLAAALQVALAMRFLVTGEAPARPALATADLWDLRLARVTLPPREPDSACPCCVARRFEFLDAPVRGATALCGRDAVQVRALSPQRPDFAAIAERLRSAGAVHVSPFVLRFTHDPYELTLFDDGRAIVKGTGDEALARSLVARWFGV